MRRKFSIFSVLFLLLFGMASVKAATISGNVAWKGEFAETTSSTSLKYEDGRPYSRLEVLLVCVDILTKEAPPDGPVSFRSSAGSSVLRGGSGAPGVAAIHWLFDEYYLRFLKGGNSQQQWAFQYALWELGNDFNGDVSTIGADSGESQPFEDTYFAGQTDFVTAYEEMYESMINTLPTLPVSYRSSTLTLDFLANNNPTQQDMVAVMEGQLAIAPPPVPVPLDMPIALMSVVMGLLAFGVKRKLG